MAAMAKLVTLLVVITLRLTITQAHFHLSPNTVYTYRYEGTVDMQSTIGLRVDAEIDIVTSDNPSDRGQYCRMEISDYRLVSTERRPVYSGNIDLSRWMFFDMNTHGEITQVFWPKNEQPDSVNIKKGILTTIGSKLVISQELVDKEEAWAYRVNETGQEGQHESEYQAQPGKDGILFTKRKLTQAATDSSHEHTKTIYYHHAIHVPKKVTVTEQFRQLADSRSKTHTEEEAGNPDIIVPKLHASGEAQLVLERTELLSSEEREAELAEYPRKEDMKHGTLEIEKEVTIAPLEHLEHDIFGNISCSTKVSVKATRKWAPCFEKVKEMLTQLCYTDLSKLMKSYLQGNVVRSHKRELVEAFGAIGSSDAQTVLTEEIFLAEPPDEDLVMRTLVQFIGLKNNIPLVFIETLEKMVFVEPLTFGDPETDKEVLNRATLVLGSVARTMLEHDPMWAAKVVGQLENKLGVHDPWHHQHKEEKLSRKDFQQYSDQKSLWLLALGNAAFDRSYEHITSYLNTSDSHVLYKCSAVHALSKYEHEQAANDLLKVGLTHHEPTVRRNALKRYKQHTFGGPIDVYLNESHPMHANLSEKTVHRIRRGLSSITAPGFKGFHVKLKTPDLDWNLLLGRLDLGGSLKASIRNVLEIDVGILASKAVLDLDNSVYGTVHATAVGLRDYRFFVGELCAKLSAGYDFNLLKEFRYHDIKDLADLYNNHVVPITSKFQEAMDIFRDKVETYKGKSIEDIIKELVTSITGLPDVVSKLHQQSQDIRATLGESAELLEEQIAGEINVFADEVSELLKDVKEDVTKLYNKVVDVITVMLPYAYEDIKETFTAIVKAFKNIVKNPKSTIQTLAMGISRIKHAVTIIVQTKEKFAEGNFFADERRPYWMVKETLTQLENAFEKLKKGIKDAIDDMPTDEVIDKTKQYTGHDLQTLKNVAVEDSIRFIQGKLSGIIEDLREPMKPLQEAAELFQEATKSINDGWTALRDGFNTVRGLMEQIFGQKAHKEFPRKFLDSPICGSGLFPTNGNGNYDDSGISVEIAAGSTIVAPFQGMLRTTGKQNQVHIRLTEQPNEVTMTNVDVFEELVDTEVAAGEPIGVVTMASWCRDSHVHLAMRKARTEDGSTNAPGELKDPSLFLEKRNPIKPGVEQQCDHYIIELGGYTLTSGNVLGQFIDLDTTPDIPNAPSLDGFETGRLSEPRRNGEQNRKFKGFADFLSILGLPDHKDMLSIFNREMNDVPVKNVLEWLIETGREEISNRIIKIQDQIQVLSNQESCARPESMGEDELKRALVRRDKLPEGPRSVLTRRYREVEERCFSIRGGLLPGIFCSFDDQCSRVSCCVDGKQFLRQRSLSFTVQVDPCENELLLGVGDAVKTLKIWDHMDPDEGRVILSKESNLHNVMQLSLYYNVQRFQRQLLVSAGLQWCSWRMEDCQPLVSIMKNVSFTLTCTTTKGSGGECGVEDTVDRSMGSLIRDAVNVGLEENFLTDLVQELRETYKDMLIDKIKMTVKEYVNEFFRPDLCIPPITKVVGPYKLDIFRNAVPWIWIIGIIVLRLNYGLGGHFQISFQVGLCLLSQEAMVKITPATGLYGYGTIGTSILIYRGQVTLTGYFMDMKLPATAHVDFSRIPLDIDTNIGLNMIPMRLEISTKHELLRFRRKGFEWKTLYNGVIWSSKAKGRGGTMYNAVSEEKDETAPAFLTYGDSESRLGAAGWSSTGGREQTSQCQVEQLGGRHYTEPAFTLEFAVDEDEGLPHITYCVGTYMGGCNVVKNEPLDGLSSISMKRLIQGVPLYFTITAANEQGLESRATCHLPTYDQSLPSGRVTPEFYFTSHPHMARVTVMSVDDSPLVTKQVGLGYGSGIENDQIVNWHDIDDKRQLANPLFVDSLSEFTAPQEGRLQSVPFSVTEEKYVYACSKECISFPTSKCRSFNYDYGSGTCELLHDIEGPQVHLHKSGLFQHFERLGVGQLSNLRYDGLNLIHNTIMYYNMLLVNSLGYTNILTGRAVLVDLTPPFPGLVQNEHLHILSHEHCENFLPERHMYRCAERTPLKNFRFIIDGEGSETVFNGHDELVDQRYTRANTMISANWDGMHDNETHILMYTWAVGTFHCDDELHPHRDPHDHLYDESDWTHQATAYPLDLEDGDYHVTVRAINKVDFGGPMAVEVCHSTPLTVDTSPPIIHEIAGVDYNEDEHLVFAEINATDPQTPITASQLGIGHSTRDTALLDWTAIENYTNLVFPFHIEDGIPAWIRARFTNIVDLRSIGNADKPILVDTTPPIAGLVFDGEHLSRDIDYQSDTTRYCANWHDFYDPHSGITEYWVSMGTSARETDLLEETHIDRNTARYCLGGLSLQHNHSYYTTVTAVNGGHVPKNVTACSLGVTIDTTAPTRGWVKDGTNQTMSIQFSSDPATVAAVYGGFTDPESGVSDYRIDVLRKQPGEPEFTQIHEESTGISDNNSASFLSHHFHMHHADGVKVQVTTTNNADKSTSATSAGYIVDLTEPAVVALVDGMDIGRDMHYTSSTTSLAASWVFVDPESSLSHFRIKVYEVYAGTRRKIYPSWSEWEELGGDSTSWANIEPLHLKIGASYSIRVSAVNGAGLTNVQDTSGVIVDPTPPEMLWVHAGVLSGGSEEVIGGYVIHNDEHGIPASWNGLDPESGIQDYVVAVGSTPGASDVMAPESMGPSQSAYLADLNLQLTDETTNSPVYYITVGAHNGAGEISDHKVSSPIKVVPGDITGLVRDGPSIETDVDYQSDTMTATVSFAGFESARDGIARYEWSLGTEPASDDVLPYSSEGLLIPETGEPHIGVGGAGHGQVIAPLTHSTQYYTTVRAVTGAGNVLESESNGFTLDQSPPEVYTGGVGNMDTFDNTSRMGDVYQTSGTLASSWNIREHESEVMASTFYVGRYPGAADVHPPTFALNVTSVPNGLVTADDGGIPNILSVDACNAVDLCYVQHFPAVIVDGTPPEAGEIWCPDFIQGGKEIQCTWTGARDPESSLSHYMFGIGTSEGIDNVYKFKKLESGMMDHRTQGLAEGEVVHGHQYYSTLTAVNRAGLSVSIYSSPMVVDDTPPKGNLVVELADVFNMTLSGETVVRRDNITCTNGQEICPEIDADCQKSISQIGIAWGAFSDNETPIVKYEVALGTTPGGTQILKYVEYPPEVRTIRLPVDLSSVTRVFATVRGFNAAGLYSTVTSNGVYVSRISAGLDSLKPPYVYDGNNPEKDLDFQDHKDALYAQWDFSGDPCPIDRFQWTVYRFDGNIKVKTEDLFQTARRASATDIEINDQESFYVVVTGTNLLGYTYSVRSDGITIRLEPPLPGIVRDGDIIGVDLDYQMSLHKLSANWDGFGGIWEGANTPHHDPESEIGNHQAIAFYEIAAGTDRRYPNTKTNVHPFINVGLNKTWTFTHLDLLPHPAVYYITVRAHSISTATVDSTSNGIEPGHGSSVITIGEINMNKYIPSLDSLTFSWEEFEFAHPLLFYHWGMGTKEIDSNETGCAHVLSSSDDIEESRFGTATPEHLFDAYPLSNVGMDTYVAVDDLHLEQGQTYHITVIASDKTEGCSMSHETFTTDVTPPEEGELYIAGGIKDLPVLYNLLSDELHVEWSGFDDPESGIKEHKVSLMRTKSCLPHDDKEHLREPFLDLELVAGDTGNFSWLNVELQVYVILQQKAETPYYIHFNVTNNAGLSTFIVSRPILLDLEEPYPGTVKDGTNFFLDEEFQNSTTEVHGVLLYQPYRGDICPSRHYSLNELPDDWSYIIQDGLWNIEGGKQEGILFTHLMAAASEAGMEMEMRRDTRKDQMISTAISTPAEVLKGGSFKFEIKAASGDLRAATSVTFWDGPPGTYGDFINDIFSKSTDIRHSSNSDDHDQDYLVIPPEPDGSTHNTTSDNFFDADVWRTGFGFQIHPNSTYDGLRDDHIVMWGSKVNDTKYVATSITFDPSDWHTYELRINDNDDSPEDVNWNLELYVDGTATVVLTGVTRISENATVVSSVHNRHGWIPPLDDMFNPPSTSAHFKNMRFPPRSDIPCRHGNPFVPSTNPIVEFWAGVGTEKGLDDIGEFRQIAKPCVPCHLPCDIYVCDSDCAPDSMYPLTFTIDGLDLEPVMELEDNLTMADNGTFSNGTFLTPYYVCVRAVTGSSQRSVASANGIFVDDTPPIVREFYHVDIYWDPYEPTTHQGNNHSIGVFLDVIDEENEIREKQWGIGSIPGATDIQDYRAGSEELVMYNTELEGILQDGATYYVTVLAINMAGLRTTATSHGVTIDLSLPNVSNTSTAVDGSEGFGNMTEADDCVHSSNQEELHVSWGDIETGEPVDGLYFSLGTTEDEADVFPDMAVAQNESGSLTLSADGVHVEDLTNGSMSDLNPDHIEEQQRQKRNVHDPEFLMEPGRSLHINLQVASLSHLKSRIPMDNLVFLRDGDTISHADEDGQLTLELSTSGGSAVVSCSEDQPEGKTLVGGTLTESDVTRPYRSAASNTFKPYIVNPSATMAFTDRELRHRVGGFHGTNIYLTALPGYPVEGPLSIQMPFDRSDVENHGDEFSPKILSWCPKDTMWVDAAYSCSGLPGVDRTVIDWEKQTVAIKVCDIRTLCSKNKLKQQTEETPGDVSDFLGPAMLSVATVNDNFQNSHPVITTKGHITIEQDCGTIYMPLTAYDPDGDDFVFLLEESPSEMSALRKEIKGDGWLIYSPCRACHGIDIISFKVTEVRGDAHEPLSSQGQLEIHITPINDNPYIMMFMDGVDVTPAGYKIALPVEENTKENVAYRDLEILVIGYDTNTNDKLTLNLNSPDHGNLTIFGDGAELQVEGDCQNEASAVWESVVEELKAGKNEIDFSLPCNHKLLEMSNSLTWMAALLLYRPHSFFHGEDHLKAIIEDRAGAMSDLIETNVYVLRNPCVNNGTCAGPETDPGCISFARSACFDGYSCSCINGTRGDYCQYNIDECASNPCPEGALCVDLVGGYMCDLSMINDTPAWKAWQVVLLCLGILASVAMVIIFVLYVRSKNKKLQKVAPSDHNRQGDKQTRVNWNQARFHNRVAPGNFDLHDVYPEKTNDMLGRHEERGTQETNLDEAVELSGTWSIGTPHCVVPPTDRIQLLAAAGQRPVALEQLPEIEC